VQPFNNNPEKAAPVAPMKLRRFSSIRILSYPVTENGPLAAMLAMANAPLKGSGMTTV